MHLRPSKEATREIPVTTVRGDASVLERLAALNTTQRYAVLATVADNQPHTSLVAFTLAPDGQGIVFATPRKTSKYRNILANSRVSVLVDSRTNSEEDYMAAEAITVIGTALVVRKGRFREELCRRLKGKHPQLSSFFDSPGTAIVVVRPHDYIHVGAFQSVTHLSEAGERNTDTR